jgi:hypothetical protein
VRKQAYALATLAASARFASSAARAAARGGRTNRLLIGLHQIQNLSGLNLGPKGIPDADLFDAA